MNKVYILVITISSLFSASGCSSVYFRAADALTELTVSGNQYESYQWVSVGAGKRLNSMKISDEKCCILKLELNNTREKTSLFKAINELQICMKKAGWELEDRIITVTSP